MGDPSTPDSVQKLQTALHAKAKAEPGYRFYAQEEAAFARFAADEDEAQELEGLRLAQAASFAVGRDNVRPSRLEDLIANAIDDFVVRAEGDIEEGEEGIEPGPALIELAATAVKKVVFEYQLDPKVVMRYVAGRLSSLCMTELERSEPLCQSAHKIDPRSASKIDPLMSH